MPQNLVFTDDFPAYDGLDYGQRFHHRRIRHSEKIYVAGEVHTQTIEGFWSLIKRGIAGVYHNVGRHYLQTYLNEYSFRYNHRFDVTPMIVKPPVDDSWSASAGVTAASRPPDVCGS